MNKLLTFYTDSHEGMFNEFFLKSYNDHLSGDYELIVKKVDQLCPSGNFASQGFDEVMLEKVKWIIENIDINNESYLVFSDCDVQFFKNIDIDLSDYDILFQNDYMHDAYCAGFFIMKQNNKTMDFFTLVRDTFLSMMNGRVDDQSIVNMLLKKGVKDLKYGFLPSGQYWTVAYATNGRAWTGEDISCPDSLVAHHANWTIGVNNKMDLLQLVKSKQIQS